jgi:hypothetical protein
LTRVGVRVGQSGVGDFLGFEANSSADTDPSAAARALARLVCDFTESLRLLPNSPYPTAAISTTAVSSVHQDLREPLRITFLLNDDTGDWRLSHLFYYMSDL